MFLLLILPILISGFYVCNHNPYYFYRLHRFEGQYLYLKSALLGFTCLLIASFSALLLNSFVSSKVFGIPVDVIAFINYLISSAIETSPTVSKELSWVILLSMLTQIIGWLWVLLSFSHIKWKESNIETSKVMLMSTILNDSPLDNLLLESYISEAVPLMLTLSDRKVYVGVVSSLGEPNESEGMDQEIALIPLMSGYRDEDTLQVSFNTDYKVVEKDLYIIIKQDLISTATIFDFDTYLEFLNHRPSKPKQPFWRNIGT